MPKGEKSIEERDLGFKFEKTIRDILMFLHREDDQIVGAITKAREESKTADYMTKLEKKESYQRLLFPLLWEYLFAKYHQDEDGLRQELTDIRNEGGPIITAYRNQYNIEGIVNNDFRPFCEAVSNGTIPSSVIEG